MFFKFGADGSVMEEQRSRAYKIAYENSWIVFLNYASVLLEGFFKFLVMSVILLFYANVKNI